MYPVTVSAVIPTYNRARHVVEAVASCLAQTYPCHEVIVIDDGSTDNTLAMLEQYGDSVRVVCQSNSGPAVARTTGVRAATGDYVAFLDDDDTWLPDKIEREVEVLIRDSAVATYSDFAYVTASTNRSASPHVSRRSQPADMWKALLMGNWLSTSNVVVKRDALLNAGPFDIRFPPCEDWDMWLRIAQNHRWSHVPEVLTLVLWHDQGISKNVRVIVRSTWKLLDKHTNSRGGSAPIPRRLKRHAYSAAHYRVAMYFVAGGQYFKAAQEMVLGLCIAPERLLLEPRKIGLFLANLKGRGHRHGAVSGTDVQQDRR